MEIEFDEKKRLSNLNKHHLDFADAPIVFSGSYFEIEDDRQDYGEQRFLIFGELRERRVVLAWTPRGSKRRIIMMRHAHAEEFEAFRKTLD